jgi:L-histidine Nalpha-methyltransferase
MTSVVHSHLDTDAPRTLAEDVLDGLTRPAKELAPKYFYDTRGSELFDRITELPEYYPTRAERAILEAEADAIVAAERSADERAARGRGAAELVELGSGTAAKTRVLLDAMARAGTLRRYVPFDVDEQLVRDVADALTAEYPGLDVHGVAGDFERHLDEIPPAQPGSPRIVAFLGGTIGNFPPGSRRRFLRTLAERLDDDGFLLLGTDLVKDPRVLEAAYDDSAGVTAEFNRNVLLVLNRELGADFDPALFDHVAFYDPAHQWIEMRLRARRAHTVHIPAIELDVEFARGEELRTEISAKFTPERVAADLAAAGLELRAWLTDPQERFALSLARRRR